MEADTEPQAVCVGSSILPQAKEACGPSDVCLWCQPEVVNKHNELLVPSIVKPLTCGGEQTLAFVSRVQRPDASRSFLLWGCLLTGLEHTMC